MKNRSQIFRTALVLTCGLLAPASVTVLAQDAPSRGVAQDVSRVKGLYESADYEQALQLIATLKGQTSNTEAAAYQVFCLVALGRRDEAKTAIEAIVRTDPLYRPSEAQVSPRIRSFFDDVRKPLLPEIVRQSYANAKAAFDKKDWAPAKAGFDRVMTLLNEIGGAEQGVADLRTLAAGFRDLASTSVKPEPVATPTPTPVAPPPPPPAPAIYGDSDRNVERPVSISKRLPDWYPSPVEARMDFEGTIELVINEDGRVASASLLKNVHPRYDGPLLQAAKTWTFKPATKNGVPVKYRYAIAVKLAGR